MDDGKRDCVPPALSFSLYPGLRLRHKEASAESERVFRTTRIAVTSTRSNEILLSLLLKTTVNSFNVNIKYFETITYTLFYIRMLFFRPRLNILIFPPILGLKYSKIIAYDISVLEFIRVSITSVWYLDLYGVALCTCSIAFRCSQRDQDVTSNDNLA